MIPRAKFALRVAVAACACLVAPSFCFAQQVVYLPTIKTAPVIRGAATLKLFRFDAPSSRIEDPTSTPPSFVYRFARNELSLHMPYFGAR